MKTALIVHITHIRDINENVSFRRYHDGTNPWYPFDAKTLGGKYVEKELLVHSNKGFGKVYFEDVTFQFALNVISDASTFNEGGLNIINQGINHSAKLGGQNLRNDFQRGVDETNGAEVSNHSITHLLRDKDNVSPIDTFQVCITNKEILAKARKIWMNKVPMFLKEG